MKRCPRCHQTYTDNELNFCLNDGELLMAVETDPPPTMFGSNFPDASDDAPPTVLLNTPRITNQTNWQPGGPMAQWQGQTPPIQPWQGQPANVPFSQYAPYGMTMSPNQTLAVVSLCMGIGSVTIGWCCSVGLLLSPAALITGFIALSQIKKDPNSYGGRGLAIGGVATGAVFLAVYLLFIIIYGFAIIGGVLSGSS